MNTTTTQLSIAANPGLLRACRVAQGRADRPPPLEMVHELQPGSAHQRMRDPLSDQPGRFSKGGGPVDVPGNPSAGGQRDLVLEQRRRPIKPHAGKINALLAEDGVETCSLAVSGPIHFQLLDGLAAPARRKVAVVVAPDLTKTNPSELLNHFQP